MSRKGKLPIALPKGVEVKISGENISVKGPKGTLLYPMHKGIGVEIDKEQIHVTVKDDATGLSNFHGLYRSLIQNMIQGATQGFERQLEMVGIGYRAAVQGKNLDLQIGLSHPTKLPIPEGINVTVDKGTVIVIKGLNKQAVGQFAATIRAQKPPEPYQGKGIRYAGEYVRKKAGKAAAAKK